MSLETPTTKELNDSIVAQMEASLNQAIPLLPKSFTRVLAKVLAAIFIILYKYGGYIFEQINPSTAQNATTEINGQNVNPLVQWGRLVGVGDPIAAVNAELQVEITVTNQTGSLPSGTQLLGDTNGVTYITIGDVLLNAATVTANIRAVDSIGNLADGSIVSFANPLANIKRQTVVLSTVTEGVDKETTESYRARVIAEFNQRAQGGALADYKVWAESATGILNAYPYTSNNPGQVDVYCESADGIPTSGQLQGVLDAINASRPANALANALAITLSGFDVEVIGLQVNNTSSVQASIISSVNEYFANREPFIVGLSPTPRRDRVALNDLRGIVSDIVSAAGGVYSDVNLKDGAVDIEVYSLGRGEKAKADSVGFV